MSVANHPAPPLALDDASRAALSTWARSRALPQRQVLRAQIVLCAGEGLANRTIAARLRCSVPTVLLWRRRFVQSGVAGLEQDAPRPGRPPIRERRQVARVGNTAAGARAGRPLPWSRSSLSIGAGPASRPAGAPASSPLPRFEFRRARAAFTIYDVARHAGLSTATVSRVLNGSDKPRAETRERVLLAVRDLRYVRDGAARALSSGLKEVVGVVFRIGGNAGDPDAEDEGESPIFDEVVTRGIEVSARRTSFDVLVSMIRIGDASRRLPTLAGKTDGLILHDRLLSGAALAELAAQVPVVILGGRPSPLNLTMSVRSDNAEGARALVRHLAVDHGYRTIAYLSGYADSPDSQARGHAVQREAGAAGAWAIGGPEWTGDYSARGGAGVIIRLLEAGQRLPRAIVCANDLTAMGVLHVLAQHSIRVPDEVAVTGFDDIGVARHLHPALTTVRQPLRGMGMVAFDLLHATVTGAKVAQRDVVLPVELVIRQSCGCAAAGRE